MLTTFKMFPIAGAMLALSLAAGATAQAQTAPTAVPKVNGPIPVTASSHIYMAAADARIPLDLPARGYVEEEYFTSGAANVYAWAPNGDVSVHNAGTPYTARVLVRRPSDPKRFSGTVWVEFLNPVSGTDMSLAWGYANYSIMDRGDAYIGISAAGDSFKTLKKFDAKRYASLAMPNPAPLAGGCKEAGRDYSAETEDGLRWDVLSQVGALLKSDTPGRPLEVLKVERLFVFGQSNGDLPTYISAFHKGAKLTNGKPVFDGYLVKDSGIDSPVAQCDPRPTETDPRRVMRNIGVPVIQLVVDDGVFNNFGSRRLDSDDPADRYRRYEVPGSSHVDNAAFDWLPKPSILAKVGIAPSWPEDRACFPRRPLSDFPVHYFVSGAMENLDLWVRKGVKPPSAPLIQVTGEGKSRAIVKDQYGNALGGVRNAYVEVPTAAYNQPAPCSQRGAEIPFTWERLDTLYGDYKGFSAKFSAAVDRYVRARWIPQMYAARIKAGLRAMPTTDQADKSAAPPPGAAD